MCRKSFFIIPIFIFLSAYTLSQDTKVDFTEYDLDNGLHVILHEDHSAPVVTVSVMYHVGSKNEDTNRTGMAHFFEHLMFEGSKNIDRGEFSNYVEKAGGVVNANTNQDRTYYFEVLPSNNFELGLWLESERMLHAKIDEKGLETQREVVKEEKRQRVDNQPYGSFQKEMFGRLFKKHPYRWTIIGSMDDLNSAKMSDFMNFYETYYVPNNATLSIAGDIQKEKAKKLIKKYFAPIPKGKHEIPRPDKEEPPLISEIRDTIYDDIQLPGVMQGYRMPAQGTDDAYAMQMLNNVLSRGESSRLHKKIVDEEQMAVNAASFPFTLEDHGVNMIFSIANQGVDPKSLEDTINSVIQKVKKEGVTDREFKKVKNQMENQFINSKTSMRGIARNLAKYNVLYGNTNLINTELKKYQAVTKKDIKRVANKYLTKDNRVVLYYLKKPEN